MNQKQFGHRLGIVITGEELWVRESLHRVYRALCPSVGLWLSHDLPGFVGEGDVLVARGSVGEWLGSESDFLVVDGFSGLNPDAVAALAGTLKQTGVMVVLAPDLAHWGEYADPEYHKITVFPYSADQIPGLFLRRFANIIEGYCDAERFVRIQQGVDEGGNVISELETRHSLMSGGPGRFVQAASVATEDQLNVIRAVEKVVRGHRRRPLVLTADRGRGKSAALGMALGRLMQEKASQFLVTAPSLATVERLFFHLAEALDVPQNPLGMLEWRSECGGFSSVAQYCSPENVQQHHGTISLLVVDEAAALGTPMLVHWLALFPRLVFSTTLHGYEGSGQGFAIRFLEHLRRETPHYQQVSLTQPIRWSEGDEVEAFLNESFLLAEGSSQLLALEGDVSNIDIKIVHVDRMDLANESALLKGLFGLLVSAHYKTTPSDLRNMLDGPNLEIFIATAQGAVVGALLLAKEGAFDAVLASAIWQGQRRPRGHLIPQTLAVQCGYQQGLLEKSARIIRVAVHPTFRLQGVGRQLIDASRSYASRCGFDWLGSSFGATASLIQFWKGCGLAPVRVGITLDVASGSYSCLVLSALNKRVETDFFRLKKAFGQHFVVASRNYYQRMPSALMSLFVGASDVGGSSDTVIVNKVREDVDGFITYQWPYDVVFPSLCAWFVGLLHSENSSLQLADDDVTLLVDLFVRQQSLESVANRWGAGGRKALLKKLKLMISTLK